MNSVSPPQSGALPAPAKRLPALRADSDFLPAALEILETPPSPNKIAFLVTICAFAAAAVVWSWFGHLDIIAAARGKIQPTGRVKLIQPSETGKIAATFVRNGAKVKEGDILIELDATDAQTDEAGAAAALASWRAEALRRKAVLAAAASPGFEVTPIIWPESIPQLNRDREDRILSGDVAQLSGNVASFDAQIQQKQAEKRRLEDTLIAQKTLLGVLQSRVDMREALVRNGAGPLTNLIDAKENLSYHSTTYATTKGQIEETGFGLDVLARDRDKTINNFIAENRQKLGDAERQADDFEQKLAKTRVHLAHLAMKSPIAGTVAASTVTNVGQVVTTGEEVMRIVPDDAALEIEAYLENKDAGFVKVGQEAIVKIESFPFTRYGTMRAVVTRVARDAIPEPDATQIEGDPAKATKSAGFAGAERTQNLVFPVTLRPEGTAMPVEGIDVPLSPGMAVDIEIRTGSRRILEFVFSPLVETASRAFKER